ncbi:hypothetical protein [Rhodococcus sp. Q]|uniref:hypothetical protein n=1 Tax=Rhodococcus sp. Q TaxID=2502252 RepID=UPI0010F8F71B|nr:hypothetical protein [Rhodococcus sp. Q]
MRRFTETNPVPIDFDILAVFVDDGLVMQPSSESLWRPEASTTRALPLDDPRWKDLSTRDGDATWVPDWLRAMNADPVDGERFTEQWPALVSEGTTWPAAVAAFPYLVSIARRVSVEQRLEYVTVLGLIVSDSTPSMWQETIAAVSSRDVGPDPHAEALAEARRITVETAALPHRDERDLRYVLMTLAALNGHSELSAVLDDLDDEETCPRYAAHLWGASGDADS